MKNSENSRIERLFKQRLEDDLDDFLSDSYFEDNEKYVLATDRFDSWRYAQKHRWTKLGVGVLISSICVLAILGGWAQMQDDVSKSPGSLTHCEINSWQSDNGKLQLSVAGNKEDYDNVEQNTLVCFAESLASEFEFSNLSDSRLIIDYSKDKLIALENDVENVFTLPVSLDSSLTMFDIPDEEEKNEEENVWTRLCDAVSPYNSLFRFDPIFITLETFGK